MDRLLHKFSAIFIALLCVSLVQCAGVDSKIKQTGMDTSINDVLINTLWAIAE